MWLQAEQTVETSGAAARTNETTFSTTYDAAGRVASVADAKGTTTTWYDGTDAAGKLERRGLATSVVITRGGPAGTLTFSGAYDAEGKLVTQKLPGGITATNTYDQAGEPPGLTSEIRSASTELA